MQALVGDVQKDESAGETQQAKHSLPGLTDNNIHATAVEPVWLETRGDVCQPLTADL